MDRLIWASLSPITATTQSLGTLAYSSPASQGQKMEGHDANRGLPLIYLTEASLSYPFGLLNWEDRGL